MKYLRIAEDGTAQLVEETVKTVQNPDTFLKALGFVPPPASSGPSSWDGQRVVLGTDLIVGSLKNSGSGESRTAVAIRKPEGACRLPIKAQGNWVYADVRSKSSSPQTQPASNLKFLPPTGFDYWVVVLFYEKSGRPAIFAVFINEKGTRFCPPFTNTHSNGEQCTGDLRLTGNPRTLIESAQGYIQAWEQNVGNLDLSLPNGFTQFNRWDADLRHAPENVDWSTVLQKTNASIYEFIFSGGVYGEG